MGTTLQINSLEALERLIGNDNETEVAIRNSIVLEFTKKHLKSIANESAFQHDINQFKQKLQDEFDKKVNDAIATIKRSYESGPIQSITLNSDVTAKINTMVGNKVEEKIAEAVEGGIKYWEQDAKIDKRVSQLMDYHAEQHIKTEVKKRLNDVVGKLIS